jgi:hypothetical protein
LEPILIAAGAAAVAYYVAKAYKAGKVHIPTIGKSSATGVGVNVPWITGGNSTGVTGNAVVGHFAVLATHGADVGVYVTGYSGGSYRGNISWGEPSLPQGVRVGDYTDFVDADIGTVIDKQQGLKAGWPTGVAIL